jgi:hypothetical protein
MNTVLLALGVLLAPTDTVPNVAPPDSAPAATLLPSYAPTLDHLSVLHGSERLATFAPGPGPAAPVVATGPDSTRRPRAVEYSDLYYTRLKIHRIGSYLTVPLFVAQYLAGRELWNHPDSHGLARDVHGPLAAGIAGLFAVNTVTGAWNLWDSRKDPSGRTRRWVHGLTMIAADVGFVLVGATAPDDDFGEAEGSRGSRSSGASTHRNLAIGSMGLALGSYVMMLVWKD